MYIATASPTGSHVRLIMNLLLSDDITLPHSYSVHAVTSNNDIISDDVMVLSLEGFSFGGFYGHLPFMVTTINNNSTN